MDCFVLDNHGFIILSSNPNDTGKFLGETSGHLMQRLISENIYEEVNITDYQAVCHQDKNENNPANILRAVCISIFTLILHVIEISFFFLWIFFTQPFMHVYTLLKWIGNVLIWTFMHTFIIPVQGTDCDYDSGSSTDSDCRFVDEKEEEPLNNRSTIITRTRLYSCDQVIRLYSLSSSIKNKTINRVQSCER